VHNYESLPSTCIQFINEPRSKHNFPQYVHCLLPVTKRVVGQSHLQVLGSTSHMHVHCQICLAKDPLQKKSGNPDFLMVCCGVLETWRRVGDALTTRKPKVKSSPKVLLETWRVGDALTTQKTKVKSSPKVLLETWRRVGDALTPRGNPKLSRLPKCSTLAVGVAATFKSQVVSIQSHLQPPFWDRKFA
jgi:hypothetical protein